MVVSEILSKYFSSEESIDGLRRATLAYHQEFSNLYPGSHRFCSDSRTATCNVCGRTRENVRWGEQIPLCAEWKPCDIEGACLQEEQRYRELLSTANQLVPKLLRGVVEVTGDLLAKIHHTYGFDPEVVSNFIEVDESLMKDYLNAMAKHSAVSRKEIT